MGMFLALPTPRVGVGMVPFLTNLIKGAKKQMKGTYLNKEFKEEPFDISRF